MSIGTDSPVPPPVATLTMTLLWNWWTDIKTLVAAWRIHPSFLAQAKKKPCDSWYFDVL